MIIEDPVGNGNHKLFSQREFNVGNQLNRFGSLSRLKGSPEVRTVNT